MKRETTHAGDTEQVFNEVIVTDDFELAFIWDEDCVDDPEVANFDVTLNCENLELSEHISNCNAPMDVPDASNIDDLLETN